MDLESSRRENTYGLLLHDFEILKKQTYGLVLEVFEISRKKYGLVLKDFEILQRNFPNFFPFDAREIA